VVDTATVVRFEAIKEAAETRYGKDSTPKAIYLTHGHPDHAGAALALAAYWDVPIYIHPMELPYVTGKADYPPLDPTTGGALALIGRFYSGERIDLSDYVRPLPEGKLPGLSGWQAVPTPGHSPGHLSFFREADRVLLAGDACTTVDLDKWDGILHNTPKLCRPPSPTTSDWVNARKSLKRLADLEPLTIAAGHGQPMSGGHIPKLLRLIAEQAIIPLKGRYVSDPAQFDENGVTYLPPKPKDTLPGKVAVALGSAAVIGIGIYLARRKHKEKA
jgi:glyoxylase-like metal-dependent hydrolase (beta-lactamase superfamily II)